jgi:hypothetical protein
MRGGTECVGNRGRGTRGAHLCILLAVFLVLEVAALVLPTALLALLVVLTALSLLVGHLELMPWLA